MAGLAEQCKKQQLEWANGGGDTGECTTGENHHSVYTFERGGGVVPVGERKYDDALVQGRADALRTAGPFSDAIHRCLY